MKKKDLERFDAYMKEFDELNKILEDHIKPLKMTLVDIDKLRKETEKGTPPEIKKIAQEMGPAFDSNLRAVKYHVRIANKYMDALNFHVAYIENMVRFCKEHSG